ncbi:uncharacterized protein LOC133174614 [Saccostrea echinata]|uniref:uncharacterized protein LOC133174614 n=1 Tax=Saccostrea echinata TaxID=191078 RepID=UPI002A8168D2|nr:uncharacterized protein LOC133174614 [Saccostrea echinata]
MDHIPRLSEVLYVGLSRKIGTPTQVAIRRDVKDMEDLIQKLFTMHIGIVQMDSGSYREGFRLTSSDRDRMSWSCKYKLITDISQYRVYNVSKHHIILIEDSDTPPGFVILRHMTSSKDSSMLSTCLFPFKCGLYISSSLWREMCLNNLARYKYFQQANCTNHGPCYNYFERTIEYDHTACFATMYWPKRLGVWVERCWRHNWPPVPVLKNILRNGCHCVPVGSKIISTSNELEWRLSFSQAEQQLVCIMNHTQFLCYGLLKIFLKEVINYRKEPILCSYYMKTTMFWIIQLVHVRWCPNNLLDCFWKCFKYLIHCVYRGVLPNFFIPQNNMFINKVVGDARESLLQQLYQYHRMGVSCLLLSPTLRLILEPALCRPSFVLSTAEGDFTSVKDIDKCSMTEIFRLTFSTMQLSDCYLHLKSVDTLSQLSLSPYQLLTLQYCEAETLVHFAFTLANSTSCYTHKEVYLLDRMICNLLQLASKRGSVSHLLYLALYYYRTGRYDKTLHIIYLTKQRLSQACIMYYDTSDRHRYNQAVRNLPLSRKMMKYWVDNVHLFNSIPCIKELSLEQNGMLILHLSPFLTVEMLSVLSHYRLSNRSQYLQSLTDLQTLLLYDDDGTYVPLHFRDLSWQVLGICQQVVGDLQGALQSYEESLRQEPIHKIQEATHTRIRCVKRQLHKNIPS